MCLLYLAPFLWLEILLAFRIERKLMFVVDLFILLFKLLFFLLLLLLLVYALLMPQLFKVRRRLSLNRFLLFVLDVSFDSCIVFMLSLVDLLTQVPISLFILHLWHQIIHLTNLFSFSFRSLPHSLWNSRHDHLMHTLILNSIVSILQDFPHHLLERPFPGR